MDKNEIHETLQKVAGTAMSIANKIKESDTLTMADYLDIDVAIDDMKADLEKTRNAQYPI